MAVVTEVVSEVAHPPVATEHHLLPLVAMELLLPVEMDMEDLEAEMEMEDSAVETDSEVEPHLQVTEPLPHQVPATVLQLVHLLLLLATALLPMEEDSVMGMDRMVEVLEVM